MSELTTEQHFALEQLKRESIHLSKEELHQYLIEIIRQSFIKDNMYKQLLKVNG